jgi:hypothetical protein
MIDSVRRRDASEVVPVAKRLVPLSKPSSGAIRVLDLLDG